MRDLILNLFKIIEIVFASMLDVQAATMQYRNFMVVSSPEQARMCPTRRA